MGQRAVFDERGPARLLMGAQAKSRGAAVQASLVTEHPPHGPRKVKEASTRRELDASPGSPTAIPFNYYATIAVFTHARTLSYVDRANIIGLISRMWRGGKLCSI